MIVESSLGTNGNGTTQCVSGIVIALRQNVARKTVRPGYDKFAAVGVDRHTGLLIGREIGIVPNNSKLRPLSCTRAIKALPINPGKKTCTVVAFPDDDKVAIGIHGDDRIFLVIIRRSVDLEFT